MPKYFWKAITAWLVAVPYLASTPSSQKPVSSSRCCNAATLSPRSPFDASPTGMLTGGTGTSAGVVVGGSVGGGAGVVYGGTVVGGTVVGAGVVGGASVVVTTTSTGVGLGAVMATVVSGATCSALAPGEPPPLQPATSNIAPVVAPTTPAHGRRRATYELSGIT